jgi:hypothetical protein
MLLQQGGKSSSAILEGSVERFSCSKNKLNTIAEKIRSEMIVFISYFAIEKCSKNSLVNVSVIVNTFKQINYLWLEL